VDVQERIARLFKNRGNAVVAGIVVALLAIVLLVIYLHSYRSSVNSGKQPERVLVATKLIQRGTAGKLIAQQGLYSVTSVQKDQLQAFAISDPSAIQGRLAATDIFPGQQLTQGDFTTENASSIPYQLTGPQRAIAISVDSEHGLIGQVESGDFVDVYIGTNGPATGSAASSSAGATQPILSLLAADVYVMVAPGVGSANAVLRVTAQEAPKFAFAADNTRIWLVLRPQVGASKTPAERVTLASLLGQSSTG
jgi:Flp pilus assembly protein CpaB